MALEQAEFIQIQLKELECMGKCDPSALISELNKNQQKISTQNDLYYDEKQDQIWMDQYYSNIPMNAVTPMQLFNQYHELVKKTHKYQLPYFISKDQYLYTWVDLQPNGQLKSIYSGELKTPERTIEEDFETIQKRYVRFRQLSVNSRFADEEHIHQIQLIAREHKFNTEHIVPQSWFNSHEPMKGDLHHLFVCDTKCNAARANFPYYEFLPEHHLTFSNNHCGTWGEGNFEPKYGKGMAARASLYFLLRYPAKVERSFRKKVDIPLLLRWHMESQVTEYEKHRNKAIFEIQGNRNPFIDFPRIAEQMDFTLTLDPYSS